MAEKELFKVINLAEDEFAQVHSYNASDYNHKFHIIVDGTNYNLMYRDGQFLGMPQRFGGKIYPFSKDPSKKGSFFQKRNSQYLRIIFIMKSLQISQYNLRPY